MGLLHKHKPWLLTVSPPCTLFSALQALSGGVRDAEAMQKAVEMVNFAVKMCMAQVRAGRLFVFEHPASASSWRLPSLVEMVPPSDMYMLGRAS